MRPLARPRSTRVRVLYSFSQPTETSSPYTRRLVESLGSSVDARFFSWRNLLSPWADVFHVHWPDALVKDDRAWRAQLNGALGVAFLLTRRLLRTRVVWTVHNLEPHENLHGLARLFVDQLQKRADWRIYINESIENSTGRATTILHGPIAISDRSATGDEKTDRILFFGLLRPYKGLENLINAFTDVDTGVELVITGRPVDASYAAAIEALASPHPAIVVDPVFLDADRLESLIQSSRVAVLPYRSLYNSGALLLAVELGTHVLAPRNEATVQLQCEFGADRLSLFDHPVGSSDLLDALAAAGRQPVDRLQSPGRTWATAAAAHLTVYRSA